MKLTTEWGRILRGVAITLFLACALSWAGGIANASNLYNLIAGGTHDLTTSAVIQSPLTTPDPEHDGLDVSKSPNIQLTASPYTVQTGGPTVTSTVEEGDPNNPYVNGISGSNPAALSFIFEISNPSISTGFGAFSIDGFTGWGIWYGSYVGAGTGSLLPSFVSITGTPNVIDAAFGASNTKAANSETPAVSGELVLYTNATNYGTILDPITWGSAIYSAPSYMPAVATPEPSSLVLASIATIIFGLLGCRRNRA